MTTTPIIIPVPGFGPFVVPTIIEEEDKDGVQKDFDRAAKETNPATSSKESVHDIDDSLEDEVDLASAESMDASDPPSFNPGTAAPTKDPLPQDGRIKAGKPISPSAP